MPKVIIVRGVSNRGKTTAIRGAMNHFGLFVREKPLDVLVSVELHINGNIYQVGFASSGDTLNALEENIEFFNKLQIKGDNILCKL